MNTRVIGCIAAAAVALTSITIRASEVTYIGVNHGLLFAQVGMVVDQRTLEALGVHYKLSGNSQLRSVRTQIAVHSTIEAAQETYGNLQVRISGMPTPFEGEIGEDRVLWTARIPAGNPNWHEPHDSGHIQFRRSNIVLVFAWGGPTAEALEIARHMDDLLQNDRTIAPRGTFEHQPQIKVVEFPTSIRPLSKVRAVLKPEHFPANDEVEFAVIKWWNGEVLSTLQEDKSLMIRLKTASDLVGSDKLRAAFETNVAQAVIPTEFILIAADAKNVFVTRKIELSVIIDAPQE